MAEPAEQQTLSGWGRRTRSVSRVCEVAPDAVGAHILQGPARGVLARGLGRSYGDAAQNAGGMVVRLDAGAIELDLATRQVTTSAGTSLAELAAALLARGTYLAVSPGTLHVTVGGAIASDVHGKNHHRGGSFADHVVGMELVGGDGRPTWLTPADELFWATCGGMGLTGVITRATLRVIVVESAWVLARSERADDIEATYGLLREADRTAEYSVAWLDLTAAGSALGRSVVHSGRHARAAELAGAASRARWRPVGASRLTVPAGLPAPLISPATTRLFNEAWFRKAPASPRTHLQHLQGFFYPLDAVGEWNRAYGRRGFLQYQFVVPDEATDVVTSIVGELVATRRASFLNVLKRLGPGNAGHLSFPRPGWTLAVDLPGGSDLGQLLRRWDALILSAGGRVYLTKDGRLSPEMFRAMYPRWQEFEQVREATGARGRFVSDLARRLKLEG